MILLVFTGFLLVLIKYDMKKVIAAVIGLSLFFTFVYIFAALIYATTGASDIANIAVLVLSILATALLYKFPEWYVIDALGILIGAGVASIFGVSLDVLPVVILLILLAAYDAISVYKTKHMITLAEGVVDLKTPILFVIPKRRDYSFIKDGIGKLGDGGERAAFIIGMGDLIMPSILIVSANVFLKGSRLEESSIFLHLVRSSDRWRSLRADAFCHVRKTPGRSPAIERRHYPGIPCRTGSDDVDGVRSELKSTNLKKYVAF